MVCITAETQGAVSFKLSTDMVQAYIWLFINCRFRSALGLTIFISSDFPFMMALIFIQLTLPICKGISILTWAGWCSCS